MRRHLGLLEDRVLALDGVVLLQLELVRLGALVLRRVVDEAGAGRRNEANVLSHDAGANITRSGTRQALGRLSAIPCPAATLAETGAPKNPGVEHIASIRLPDRERLDGAYAALLTPGRLGLALGRIPSFPTASSPGFRWPNAPRRRPPLSRKGR